MIGVFIDKALIQRIGSQEKTSIQEQISNHQFRDHLNQDY